MLPTSANTLSNVSIKANITISHRSWILFCRRSEYRIKALNTPVHLCNLKNSVLLLTVKTRFRKSARSFCSQTKHQNKHGVPTLVAGTPLNGKLVYAVLNSDVSTGRTRSAWSDPA
jgi:hypothetical protein